MNIKKSQVYFENFNSQLDKYTFVPEISKHARLFEPKLPSRNFLERQDIYKEMKENKIEELRDKIKGDDKQDMTFKPIISKLAQEQNRCVEDLLLWNEMKQKKLVEKKMELEMKQQENELKEMSKINMNTQFLSKLGKNNSQRLLNNNQSEVSDLQSKQNNERKSKTKTNINNSNLSSSKNIDVKVKENYVQPKIDYKGYYYKPKPENTNYVNYGKVYGDLLNEKIRNAEEVNLNFIDNNNFDNMENDLDNNNELKSHNSKDKGIEERSKSNVSMNVEKEVEILDLWPSYV